MKINRDRKDQNKVFMGSTKMGYGRPDVMYLLNDFGRITGNENLGKELDSILSDNFIFKSHSIDWSKCLSNLAEKLEGEHFDFSIGIGNFGEMIIKDLLGRGVEMGSYEIFYITRLSNHLWEKIGYVHSIEKPTVKEQRESILEVIKKNGYKKIAIVDDVTYSGGTRKALCDIGKINQADVYGVDLITLNSAKKSDESYKKWFSGYTVEEDPYPTLNSGKQADVMSVSEFILPSKYIGEVIEGKIDEDKILQNGKYRIFKKHPYISSEERNKVYFGDKASCVHRKISELRKKIKS